MQEHAHDTNIPRTREGFGDGWRDNLEPLEPLDVTKTGSISEMLTAMKEDVVRRAQHG